MKFEVIAASLLSAYFVYKLMEVPEQAPPAAPSGFFYLSLLAIFFIGEVIMATAVQPIEDNPQ